MKAQSNSKQALLTILALLVPVAIFIAAAPTNSSDTNSIKPSPPIPVAFVISDGAVIIDFCGPWEVFRDVMLPSGDHPFRLYTVSDKAAPITAGGGMKIVPDYTFANAPAPKVIVIPAQSEPNKGMLDWIRQSSKTTDVTMSVCTGAFVLAKTGLLSGKGATTFHAAFNTFAMNFPDIQLKRGARFVDNGNLATAGGLSSGIDLALHVVERYYGREVAEKTAYNMEYQGQGWKDANSNNVYAVAPISTAEHPLCPVCGMDVDPKISPKSVYMGATYYFCSDDDKKTFDTAPEKFVSAPAKVQ
jgi:transcriptional regulator GlxA family with amidase domain/YHS domain-containing protein